MLAIFTKILQSKTLIVGWLTVIAGVLTQFTDVLSGVLPPKYAGYLLVALGAINMVLRVLTVKPIANKTSLNQ